jgi:hypothetical protein
MVWPDFGELSRAVTTIWHISCNKIHSHASTYGGVSVCKGAVGISVGLIVIVEGFGLGELDDKIKEAENAQH